jgi:hypothetical protein
MATRSTGESSRPVRDCVREILTFGPGLVREERGELGLFGAEGV